MFYTDTVSVNVRSLCQHRFYQVYSCENFVHVHPMEHQEEAATSSLHLAQDVGIPAKIFSDHAELLQGRVSDFRK